MCGVVYSAREAHNLTGWAQLPTPQHDINQNQTAQFYHRFVDTLERKHIQKFG